LIAAGFVLVLVLALVIWRPRGLSVAWPAAVGAMLMLALGLVSVRDVETVVLRTWDATLALVGLMLLSSLLEANGTFRAAAHQVARASKGSGWRLFIGLALLTAVATVIVANDGAVLILTPVVADLAELVELPAAATLGYLFATGFLCDALSTLLPTANLTNILLVDTLHVHTSAFVAKMAAPWLATFAAAAVALAAQLAGVLPRRFSLAALGEPPHLSAASARATGAALAALLVGYSLAAFARIPLGVVVVTVAALLAVAEHHTGTLDARACLRALPWSIVVFATALFVVVTGVAHTGLAGALELPSGGLPAAVFHVGVKVSVLAAIGNNLPVLLMVIIGMSSGGAPLGQAYGALIGANIGSKLTPIGSLATLLWLEVLRKRGVRVSWGRYVVMAAVPTVAATLAALGVLAFEWR
jgi:arsenical pump membrane protein